MFPPLSTVRAIVACTLACGLLATMTSGPAAARPIDDARADAPTSSLAGTTTPRQHPRSSDARDTEQIAHAMEDYYQSFGKPVPVAPSKTATQPPTHDTAWLLVSAVAAVFAGALVIRAFALRRRHTARVAS